MAMSLAGNQRYRVEINVTPLIDVLLVLLIIFMVITPTVSVGLDTAVPQPADPNAPAPPRSDVIVTVRKNGTVRLNDEVVGLEVLGERLKALLATTNMDHVLFVRGEKDLDFAQVAQVIDIAKGAGMDRVALMTQ